MIVFLDTGVLGYICNPGVSPEVDVDMIIAAHWQILKQDFPGRYVVISTTNLKHLNRFAEAQEWQNISY